MLMQVQACVRLYSKTCEFSSCLKEVLKLCCVCVPCLCVKVSVCKSACLSKRWCLRECVCVQKRECVCGCVCV